MEYISTRGLSDPVVFTEAVAQGLAPDGGLYLPKFFPIFLPNYLAGKICHILNFVWSFSGILPPIWTQSFLRIASNGLIPLSLIPKSHRLFLYPIIGVFWNFSMDQLLHLRILPYNYWEIFMRLKLPVIEKTNDSWGNIRRYRCGCHFGFSG